MYKPFQRVIRSAYLWDVLVLSVIACNILAHSIIMAKLRYDGTTPPWDFVSWSDYVDILLFVLILVQSGAAIVLAVRIKRRWSKDRTIVSVLRGVAEIAVVVCWVSAVHEPPRHVAFVNGMATWVQRCADLEGISAWLTGVDDDSLHPRRLPSSQWPSIIAKLSPESVSLSRVGDEFLVVHLVWGGGFQHFGLDVAEDNWPLPPPRIRDRRFCRVVRANARVWIEHERE